MTNLTNDKLDELERLHAAGTQGEWVIDGIVLAVLSKPHGYPIDICLMGEPAQHRGDAPVMMLRHEANADLIAAAVNSLPTLVSEVRALREKRDRLRARLQELIAAFDEGRMAPKPGHGVSGMTIEANIRGSVYNGVPAWPVEEARAELETL